MSNRLTAIAAVFFGLATLTGAVAAASVGMSDTTTVAGCEYTDQENCDYDGEY